ncbi:T9SS type A sorting domain-containing protein [Pedobacter cryophilus]|uniref:T9SS type A sorting domain-containing protein n=1 Tax=Pedobacter cryophilus TaxID=2571271 RepID=A0A4U1BVS7_9SPHI|nr:T9SS type A sorting domain-containing protein [Pedobacter cryophilus]TKB96915.1 T9SS type A sorting domain-containing protein [Pedobacter cryophilus]
MKKKLLFICASLVASSFVALAQFTAGNVVVYRYGDGGTYTNGQLAPTFLDEYTAAGVLVKTHGVPSVTNGLNKGLTGLLKLGSGLYQQEGMSTLSQDGKYITIFGYNAAVGATVPTTADGLVVGVISADGKINTTTTLSNAATVGLGAPRSAVVDGNNIWANGFQNGVQYATLGATTSIQVNTSTQNSPRTLGIFNDNLYAPTGASDKLAFQSPLPTSAAAFQTKIMSSVSTGVNPTTNQIVAFPIGNRILIYTIDDGSTTGNTIRRYNTNSAGDTWLTLGTAISSSPQTDLAKSITGVSTVVGANTVIKLYVTTWGDSGAGVVSSKLLTFTDTYVTPTTNPSTPTTSALTTLATAPAGTVFRSVTMAPQGSAAVGTGVLPVSLTSFGGQKQGDAIQLNWTTASEKNNSHFDILRSIDGKKFLNIGKVAGKGNSDAKVDYTFLDQNPLGGTNYYQLNQVDFDGKSSKSDVKAIESGIKTTELTVYANKNTNEVGVSIFSANSTTADFKIFDISGRELLNKSISLNKGYNSFNLPLQLGNGVFVTTLRTPVETISKKFINQ